MAYVRDLFGSSTCHTYAINSPGNFLYFVNEVLGVVVDEVTAELNKVAGTNHVISRAEEKSLKGLPAEAVHLARVAQAPGGRVTVTEAQLEVKKELTDLLERVNQASGSGRVWLSKAEIERLSGLNPDVGARAARAWRTLAQKQTREDGAAVQARLAPLVSGLVWDLLSSEGAQPISVVHISGHFEHLDAAALAAVLGPVEDRVTLQGGNVRAAVDDIAQFESSFDNPAFPAGTSAKAKEVADILLGLKETTTFIGRGPNDDPSLKPTWVVGIAEDGSLAGIKTAVIWT